MQVQQRVVLLYWSLGWLVDWYIGEEHQREKMSLLTKANNSYAGFY